MPEIGINPKAANHDTRWPLESVDMVYVRKIGNEWTLFDFFGDIVVKSKNRSVCFFTAVEVGLIVVLVN